MREDSISLLPGVSSTKKKELPGGIVHAQLCLQEDIFALLDSKESGTQFGQSLTQQGIQIAQFSVLRENEEQSLSFQESQRIGGVPPHWHNILEGRPRDARTEYIKPESIITALRSALQEVLLCEEAIGMEEEYKKVANQLWPRDLDAPHVADILQHLFYPSYSPKYQHPSLPLLYERMMYQMPPSFIVQHQLGEMTIIPNDRLLHRRRIAGENHAELPLQKDMSDLPAACCFHVDQETSKFHSRYDFLHVLYRPHISSLPLLRRWW